MSDAQIEGTVIQILRTMKTALHEGRVDLVPELQGKLTQCISEYMVKWNFQSLHERNQVKKDILFLLCDTTKLIS